jgi:hypothetical protein
MTVSTELSLLLITDVNNNVYPLETNKLTSWSRVAVELIVAQLFEKFLAIYGTQMFITVFTTAHNRAKSIQFTSTLFH